MKNKLCFEPTGEKPIADELYGNGTGDCFYEIQNRQKVY